MPVISSGQITIIDQNDAKPILAVISSSGVTQQSYSKDNTVDLFNPNWVSTPLTLTARVYVGGVDVVAGTSVGATRQWSTTFNGSDLGTGVTQARNTNFTTPDSVSSQIYYFRCVYTDPTTGIPSRVDAQIIMSVVKVGSNAVYVELSGRDVIVASSTITKNVAVIKAELNRSSGVDTDNLQYRWYSISTAGVATKLYNAVAGVANYGVKSTAIGGAPVADATNLGAATFTTAGSATALTGTLDADWSTAGSPGFNTLVVGEAAVSGVQVFKVEVRDSGDPDATASVYSATFTVYDVSDPYRVLVTSDNGDRLLNGVGSSQLRVKVYNGALELASYANWTFDWYLRDKAGARTGFVASAAPPTPDITQTISAATNSTTSVLLAATVTLAAGDLVKLVSKDGAIVKFAQVSAVSASATVTFQSATGDNALCGPVTTVGASEFAEGTFYKAASKKTTSGTTVGITLTQFDVDGKNTVDVDANRP